jgi:hypothetical protein
MSVDPYQLYARLKKEVKGTGLNSIYAILGARENRHWQEVKKTSKTEQAVPAVVTEEAVEAEETPAETTKATKAAKTTKAPKAKAKAKATKKDEKPSTDS